MVFGAQAELGLTRSKETHLKQKLDATRKQLAESEAALSQTKDELGLTQGQLRGAKFQSEAHQTRSAEVTARLYTQLEEASTREETLKTELETERKQRADEHAAIKVAMLVGS